LKPLQHIAAMSLKLPTPKIPWQKSQSGLLSPVARTRPILRSFTVDGVAGLAQIDEERPAPVLQPLPPRGDVSLPLPGTMAEMGLPSMLRRRGEQRSPETPRSPRWTCAEAADTWTSLKSERQLKPVDSPPARCHSWVLDFERLFTDYFVQVRPSRWRGLWTSNPVTIEPEDVVAAWAEETARYIIRHASTCYSYWPYVQLEYESVHQKLLQEMEWTVEWSGSKRFCVVVSLLPERVCHRLLWAIGDSLLPDEFLTNMQQSLQSRWRSHRFRCSDSFLRPWGTFQTLLVLCTVLMVLCFQSADAHWQAIYKQGIRDPTHRAEALDHLASRLLCLGGFGHLWVFYMVAAFFPLRTLHSPFHRDVGSMAAYSHYSLQATRILLPLVSTAKLAALLVRFERLQISWSFWSLSELNQHSFMIAAASLLPIVAISVCVGMRSSFYSYYHASSFILAAMNGVVSIGFTAYLEVGWAVLCVAAVLLVWLLLFTQYTAEFTKANLLKAAQIQWACLHGLVVLCLVLAAALEVEAGFARRFVKLFCETQTLVPMKVCQRLLSGHS